MAAPNGNFFPECLEFDGFQPILESPPFFQRIMITTKISTLDNLKTDRGVFNERDYFLQIMRNSPFFWSGKGLLSFWVREKLPFLNSFVREKGWVFNQKSGKILQEKCWDPELAYSPISVQFGGSYFDNLRKFPKFKENQLCVILLIFKYFNIKKVRVFFYENGFFYFIMNILNS